MANICPNCRNELSDKDYCTTCRLEITAYRRIRMASKLLYNEGLLKVKSRDLSGAIESLDRSIKYDKNNIDARNLLGLVYFEIGEVVHALKCWVVSQNLQPENNRATVYLNTIRDNQVNLDRLNTAVKKYNQALQYIEQGSADLAIIQLKKVITMNPNFVKAYCLLSLIYVKDNEIDKALKELVNVLTIDKSNYIALKYYEQLGEGNIDEAIVAPQKEVTKQKVKHKRQQFISQSLQQFLGVAFGLAVGAAVIFFLYMPSRIDEKVATITEREATISQKEAEIVGLEGDVNTSLERIKALEQELSEEIEENERLSAKDDLIDLLMNSMTSYLDGDLAGSAKYLEAIDITESKSGTLNNMYIQLSEIVFVEVVAVSYDEGKALYDVARRSYNETTFREAIVAFEKGFKYLSDDNFVEADNYYYFYARSYQLSGLDNGYEEALPLFEYMLEHYPNSGLRGDAQQQVDIIKATLNN
jgi:tetratricopeptide (TPR) repeat protein